MWAVRLTVGVAAVSGGTMSLNSDLSSSGAVRFGRAFCTAAAVVCDYKKSLSNSDANDDNYENLLSQVHTRSALRLRAMCCKNGGCFIKVGQHIGALEYLLPFEYIDTMKVLHSNAPHTHITDIYKTIEQELNCKVEDLFSSFDSVPHGAASLAQVHRATLKDGTPVAVKVQHPKVKSHSYVDIKTMEFLVKMVSWIFPDFKFAWLAEATKKNLPIELDFQQEAENCEKVSKMLRPFNFLKVPKVYHEYSTDRVLTMEFCEGGQINDLSYIQKHNIPVNQISSCLGRLFSEMIFVHGYIHCDPHPGNVLVQKTDKNQVKLVLLDHGLYQTLTEEFRVNYCKLWLSLINRDVESIKRYTEYLNVSDMYELLACMVTSRSWKAINKGIDQPITSDESKAVRQESAQYLREISMILNKVPREMLLIFKTNDLVRGIESTLNIRADATVLLTMSQCCIRALASVKRVQSETWYQSIGVLCWKYQQLLRISFYGFILWCKQWTETSCLVNTS